MGGHNAYSQKFLKQIIRENITSMTTTSSSEQSRQNIVQLLNTAIVKSKEQTIKSNFQERLKIVCNSKVIESIGVAAKHLADAQNISNDQAMGQLIETFRELDTIWADYVTMEGLNRLKDILGDGQLH